MHCSKKSAQQSQVADKRSEGGGLGHWMEFIHPSSMMDPGKEIGWNSKNNNNELKKRKNMSNRKNLKPKNLSTCVRIELIDELTTSNSSLGCRKSKFIQKKNQHYSKATGWNPPKLCQSPRARIVDRKYKAEGIWDALEQAPVIPGSAFASRNEKWSPSMMHMRTQAKLPLNLHCFQY